MVSTFSSGKTTIQALSHFVVQGNFKEHFQEYLQDAIQHRSEVGSICQNFFFLFFFYCNAAYKLGNFRNQCTNFKTSVLLLIKLNPIFLIQAPFPQKSELG